MRAKISSLFARKLLLACFLCMLFACSTWSQTYTYKIIHNFCSDNPNDGTAPAAGLISDGNGNLYGTTPYGGFQCAGIGALGTVYKLIPNADGTWSEVILYRFMVGSEAGSIPYPPVVLDGRGNLYGMTTFTDGPLSNGSVFELSPASNGSWRLTTLHAFTGGSDGGFRNGYPFGALEINNTVQLFGNTSSGGVDSGGVVFDLHAVTPLYWHELVAHAFTGMDGSLPTGPLVFDSMGNAYGTTYFGGTYDVGTVFKLTPNRYSFGWTETVLYSFQGSPNNGPDGANPDSGVIFDGQGNLLGTTLSGGLTGIGTIFELAPKPDGTWNETVLHSFSGPDGSYPLSGLSQDSFGNIYGTAEGGGAYNWGTVFELSRSGGEWTLQTLYAFSGYLDGGSPLGTLLLDDAGDIFGIASEGGSGLGDEYGDGLAFELSPEKAQH